MNGRIWAESEYGQGSSFIFEVELFKSELPESLGVYRQGLTILVVEDDPETKEQLVQSLEKLGMRADTAINSSEAAALAEEQRSTGAPYDAVFVEYHLRGDDALGGLGTAEMLGDMIGSERIILICSFLEWNRMENRTEKAGIKRFVAKPVFPSNLLGAINKAAGIQTEKVTEDGGIDFPDLSGISLLLAEDIEINREIFQAILEPTGIHIDVAENGRRAVEKFQAHPLSYNIIIMDVQMPEMNGLEATAAIRALACEEAKKIPIIAMTANVFKEDIEKCLESGMNDHLKKPIEEKALMAKIAFYTGKKS
jgi:CheY-like chemotaxis protein